MREKNSTEAQVSRDAERGYLLLETLVASALLLFALLAIMPLYTTATRQNSYAKDVTIASTLALDKAEAFGRWQCDNIRRGTCCSEVGVDSYPSGSISGGACGYDDVTIDGIRYRRTCIIKQNVASSRWTDDNDTGHSLDSAGMAWIQVTVTPMRGTQFATRTPKPSITAAMRVCQP